MEIAFKNCASFSHGISEINNTLIDNASYIDIVKPVYNLIGYGDNYSKTSECLWQYYRDEPALYDAGAIVNFHASNNSTLFKFRLKLTVETADNGTKDVEIMVLLKYLSNFWRTLEMPLINCEINLISTWSDKCVLSNDTIATTFAIINKNLYIPVVTLSI